MTKPSLEAAVDTSNYLRHGAIDVGIDCEGDVKMTDLRKFALALPLLLVPGVAMAASTAEQVLNDPNRPVAAVAAELEITPMQFAECFAGVTPARTASELDGAREQGNKAILLPCLQQANPAISNERLDAVMDKYRGAAPR
ncbi:hypothetical protein [Devosia sp.]|uniref:hypothetical protein n=1 Tax=Devosia sp. TaxID=1871048 RepID=UPI0032651955